MTDGDCVSCYWTHKFTEKQTGNPSGFRKKLRHDEKATTGIVYLKNASLVHLVELMEFMHYVAVDCKEYTQRQLHSSFASAL